MYVLDQESGIVGQIIKLLDEPSQDEGFIIKDTSSIRSRRSILYAMETVCEKTVRKLLQLANNDIKLIFMKKIWSADEISGINSTMNHITSSRAAIWRDEINKLRLTKACIARDERMEQLESWIASSPQRPSFLPFEETTFKASLLSLINRTDGFKLSEPPDSSSTNKPPALHWSNFPRDDEPQLSFKIELASSCLLEDDLHAIAVSAMTARQWQYTYEWRHGVLLRQEAVRVGIVEHEGSVLEVSGRVDLADIEDNVLTPPTRYVLPHLNAAVRIVLNYLRAIAMPFRMYIIPIGSMFYDDCNIRARSFDVTQFMVSVNVAQKVEFESNGNVNSVNLSALFDGINAVTLDDMLSLRAENVPTQQHNDHSHVQLHSSNLLSTNHISHHRGRRVSFGSAQSIPRSQSKDSIEDVTVDDFVDRFVGETMQEVLSR